MRRLRNMFMMRFNRRHLVFLLVLCTFMVSFSFWSRCIFLNTDQALSRNQLQDTDNQFEEMHFVNRAAKNYNVNEMNMNYRDIECLINKEYTIQCRREDNEVYMPFSFIQKYFEVYGEIEDADGYDRFEFSHSYSLVHAPGDDRTRPDGIFMSFVHYNVEIRKRVKCITATEGVPVSTQWEPSGHFYPIQIAQFALSHYSKYIQDGEPDRIPLMTGEDHDMDDWLKEGKTTVRSMWDKMRESQVLEFHSADTLSNPGIYLPLKETSTFAVSLDIRIITNGSVSFTIKSDDVTFHVHYIFTNTLIHCEGKNIFYGLGENRRGKWVHFARDIHMDLLKGLALKCTKYRKTNKLTLLAIHIRGHGWVDNVTLSSAVHLDHFFNAANWFVNHQDSRGGWPIMVTRKLIPELMELPPGWYSAMAQGHAMSTLVRAYLRSKNEVYLKAAIAGLEVFKISSAQGGVRARFADKYDWYEEYPTTPASYVLNGFIYSLFGLYDLKEVVDGEALETVTELYNTGMDSLKAMLLMFDSGTGTFYDLRHISLGIAPNRARWDYHTTHISQLLQLANMDDDPIFSRTAHRWMDYMNGKWALHN